MYLRFPGALIAQSTEKKMIIMTSMAALPWHGVTLEPVNDGNNLSLAYIQCVIRHTCIYTCIYVYATYICFFIFLTVLQNNDVDNETPLSFTQSFHASSHKYSIHATRQNVIAVHAIDLKISCSP